MKNCFLNIATVFTAALSAVCNGGEPLSWTRTPANPSPAAFTTYHGQTLELSCTFKRFGDLPFAESGVNLYWQTNGMGSAWWSMPATVISNTVSASWLPRHDPGAGRVIFFFGMQSNAYASAVVRFLPSPGFAPAVQPLPNVAFDAALMGTPTINGTNLVEYLSRIALEESDPTVPAWAKQPNPPSGTGGISTNALPAQFVPQKGFTLSHYNITNRVTLGAPVTITNTLSANKAVYFSGDVTMSGNTKITNASFGRFKSLDVDGLAVNSTFDVMDAMRMLDPLQGIRKVIGYDNTTGEAITVPLKDLIVTSETMGSTTSNIVASVTSPLSNKVDRLEGQVATIGAHLNTEDAKFIVTNYNSSTKIPAAHVQIRQKNAETGEFEWLHIWNEMTRWNKFTGLNFDWDKWPGFYSWRTNIEDQISARAVKEYAFYDGVTGDVAPDGYFWIGQPKIAICAGASYQRYVNGRNAVWILESNGMIADINGTTNGYFRISDAEGKTHFEIIKGDKRPVYAKPYAMRSEIIMGVPHYFTTYAITNAVSSPIAHVSVEGLVPGAFVPENDPNCPANVKWSAVPGGYTLEWWPKADYPSMFVYADYEIGGETYIRNTAPVSMQTIIIDGKKYKIGVSTVSGTKVLSLTEVE